MKTEAQKEHLWLQRMVGEWTFEGEAAAMEEGKPPSKWTGRESVRSLGGLWVIGEWEAETPECGPGTSIITLGYDTMKQRFVGSFVTSMMAQIWIYEGTLEGSVLTLNTEGPDMANPGKLGKYRDIVEIVDDDNRVLRSEMQTPDGGWVQFMTQRSRRVR